MNKLLSLCVLVFLVGVTSVSAQFEGKIIYNTYKISADGSRQDDDSFTLFITPERILLQGDNTYQMAGSLETEGLLIRMKEKDFIFFTGNQQAMKITKAGITSFINMFGNEQAQQASEGKVTYKDTGETKEINGYQAHKFIFTNTDNPDESSTIWMTQELDINWGMLAEPWGDSASEFMGEEGLPTDLILKEGYFPLRVEQYENETLKAVATAQVTPADIPSSKVQVPSGIQVMSLQNFLFQQMRQQQ